MFPRLIASGGFTAIAIVHSVDEMLTQLRTWEIPLRSYDLHRGVPPQQFS